MERSPLARASSTDRISSGRDREAQCFPTRRAARSRCTFARLGGFKSKQTQALRIYLRRAVENRIRDELRQVARRRDITVPAEPVVASDADAAPYPDFWRPRLGRQITAPPDQLGVRPNVKQADRNGEFNLL